MIGGITEAFKIIDLDKRLELAESDEWEYEQVFIRKRILKEEDKSIVKFLVNENHNYCCVSAEIPNALLNNSLLEPNIPIWWQSDMVLLAIIGVDDVSFKKVGYSSGNKESFYSNDY